MSLEQKLSFLNRFKTTLASSCAAYFLAVGLALGATFYGCGKNDEPGEGNQRYSCQTNTCAPDPNGPYAVPDCNYECEEEDGNGSEGDELPMDYLTATGNGLPICPLGWTRGIRADAGAANIVIHGVCSGGGEIQIVYGPTPPPGGSAPCLEITSQCDSESSPVSGQATITGSTGALRVSGSCACSSNTYSAEFSLPLNVL